MNGLRIQGSLQGVHQLPCPPQKVSSGDTYLVGQDLYAWDGRQWNSLGSMSGPVGDYVEKKEYTLIYKEVEVKILSEYPITDLFLDPENLDMDDLAIFETTYPDDYKTFEEEWSQARAKQLAKDEINEWRDKYAAPK